MSSFWSGKNVLITGCNRGIGLSLALDIAGKGGKIIAAVRATSPELDAVASQVVAGIDVTDDECGNKLAAGVDGNVDILINNSGLLTVEKLSMEADMDMAAMRAQFEVNTLGESKAPYIHTHLPVVDPPYYTRAKPHAHAHV